MIVISSSLLSTTSSALDVSATPTAQSYSPKLKYTSLIATESPSSKDFVSTPVLSCGASTFCQHSTSCHQPTHMLLTTQHTQANTRIDPTSSMTTTTMIATITAIRQPNYNQTLQSTTRDNPIALALLPSPPKHAQRSTTDRE